ncbi:tetratricopeptide repeat protein, partial [bacterium]|nr:tetratricopeptide repeat protein [bacterium]
FLLILTMGVFTSACINTFAVQQLNQIAQKFLEEGDLESAVSRLESSVDLDGNIYESRYNLAVTYMDMGYCDKALEQITVAETLVKDEPAVYYVIGAANTCLADKIFNTKVQTRYYMRQVRLTPESQARAKEFITYLQNATDAYDRYLKLAPNTDETQNLTSQISENKKLIEKYKLNYQL